MAIEIKKYKCPKCGEMYKDSVKIHFPGKPCEKCRPSPTFVACAECGVEFKSLFKPTPGREITCGHCTIKNTNLSNIKYFSDLKIFLKSKFDKTNITIARARKSTYNVIIEEKGKKPKRICSIELIAKSKDMTPVSNESRLPPFGGIIAEIKARDEKILEILNEFVKKYKSEEVSARFV